MPWKRIFWLSVLVFLSLPHPRKWELQVVPVLEIEEESTGTGETWRRGLDSWKPIHE